MKRILYHDQVSGWRRRARRAEVPVAELPERPAAGDDSDLRLLVRDAGRELVRQPLPEDFSLAEVTIAPR